MSSLLAGKIKEHLDEGLKNLMLLGQSSAGLEKRPPKVWIGDLPPKRKDKDSRELPCVLIVPLAGHFEEGSMVMTVALLCVVYNQEDTDGAGAETDLLNLISKIAELLLPAGQGTPIARRFILEPDERGRLLAWTKSENQPKPFVQADIITTWRYKAWE